MFFASCKNNDPVEMEFIVGPELFQKHSPKYAFSAMISALTPKFTMLTSKFYIFDAEEFQTA